VEEKSKVGAQAQKALVNYFQVAGGVAGSSKASKEQVAAFQSKTMSCAVALQNISNVSLLSAPAAFEAQQEKLNHQLEHSAIALLVSLDEVLPKKKAEQKAEIKVAESDNIEAYAEKELQRCAEMVRQATELLMKVPDKKPTTKMGLNIEASDIRDAILEAARAIALAVGELIGAATVAQAERKEESLRGGSKYFADPAWSNGLVSAAHQVAQKVQTLVSDANACAGGKGDEESLIAAANAVNQVTIHLLHASRVKAEPNSPSQRNLSKAAQNVSVSTGRLVLSAQASSEITQKDDEDFSKLVGSSIRAQIEQKAKIERLEKELRDTRNELLMLRRAKYQK